MRLYPCRIRLRCGRYEVGCIPVGSVCSVGSMKVVVSLLYLYACGRYDGGCIPAVSVCNVGGMKVEDGISSYLASFYL
jgi:hypothetical protein